MACAAQSILAAASSCGFASSSQRLLAKRPQRVRLFTCYNASSSSADQESDCNVEECAPEKEVGQVSMEWLAGEKTKVVGTFPPKKKGWTGYVEKDTAGQTNIYSIEPAVYVAESAISSGTAGQSSQGAENTAAIAAGLALIAVASASSVLLQLNKSQPQIQTTAYSGPPLSYYINKFKPVQMVEASVVAPDLQASPSVEAPVQQEEASSTSSTAAETPATREAQQLPSSLQPENKPDNVVSEVQAELKERTADEGASAAALAY